MPRKATVRPVTATPRRFRTILERLREAYGRPVPLEHRAPVDELVLTVLSQNTNDRNRDVAYARLRERFASWPEASDAPVAEVEEAIRPGGLAPTKAVRIRQILRAIGDDAYEVHVLLIRHGRRTCTARAPRCNECPLLRMCPYGRARVRA